MVTRRTASPILEAMRPVPVSNLRINLDDLLHARTVESERIEFKATWDRRVTGYQVLKTICAFANDLRRHGSGYIILGVAERDGRAELPPRGLAMDFLRSC